MLVSNLVEFRISQVIAAALFVSAALLSTRYAWSEVPAEQRSAKGDSAIETVKPAAAPSSDADRQALWQQAIDSIEKNYAEIKTVQGTLEQIAIDPAVDKRETVTMKLANGTATTTFAPVSISRNVFTVKGNDLRSDSYGRNKDEWTLGGKTSRRGDVWTFFHPQEPWVQIKRTVHLGGESPFDPRNYGGQSEKHGLLDQMRRGRPLEVVSRANKWQIRTEIIEDVQYAYRKGHQHSYVLDPAMNYLPTQVISYCDDGSINIVQELTYDEVIPHKAWFMREWAEKLFHPDKKVADASSNQWRNLIIARIVGPLRIDEDVKDNVFDIQFPPGTRISDMVHRR